MCVRPLNTESWQLQPKVVNYSSQKSRRQYVPTYAFETLYLLNNAFDFYAAFTIK